MSPRVIRASIVVTALLGTIALAAVLLASLRPTKKPRILPSADISTLAPGHWMTVDSDRLRFFVVRPVTGDAYAVAVPIENGEVLLPEVYWWKPYTTCKSFGLDTPDGRANVNSRFHCRDTNLPEDWVQRWQWDARGKHVPTSAGKIDNMHGVTVEVDGDELVIVGLEPD